MPNEPRPFPLSEVLLEELEAIKGASQAQPPPLEGADGKPTKENEVKRLRWIYDAAYKCNLSALCLSGGGIRSAAFSLGIIQALADRDLLQKFDYLSTVSGGGYIGAWLSARLHRTKDKNGEVDTKKVMAELRSRRVDDPDREPKPIEHLREYSSYLTPKVGLLTADTWAALAIILRNIGLNWLILVPLICLPVILVKVVAALVHTGRFGYAPRWSFAAAFVCCLSLALSIGYQLYRLYASREISPAAATEQKWFLWLSVLPATIAGGGVAWLANQQLEHQGLTLADALLAPTNASSVWHEWQLTTALVFTFCGIIATVNEIAWLRVKDAGRIVLAWAATGLLWGLLMWVGVLLAPTNVPSVWHGWRSMAALGFLLYGLTALVSSALALLSKSQMKTESPGLCVKDVGWNILAWAVAGLLWGSLMWLGVRLYWIIGPLAIDRQVLLVVFGLPWLLLAMRIGQLVYIGGRSYSRPSDFEREWLGRAAGWFLIVALAWIVLSSLVFLGTALYQYSTVVQSELPKWVAAISGASGAVTALLGMSSFSPGRGRAKDWKGVAANVGLAVAGPLFAGTLLILLSMLFDRVVVGSPYSQSAMFTGRQADEDYWSEWVWTGGVSVVLIIIMFTADYFINVNRFSLHALYRNRLMRAFLGASHYPPDRRPDGFTGFDQYDNLRVGELWDSGPCRDQNWRPFHVINMTLNLASSKRLAWQQRKGISFTVTPKFCGAAGDEFGYRRTKEYGDPGDGISLGTAMAISGAAVSPNMGYHSSPSIAFLLTFFNVRLGWWLGNPGAAGDLFKFGPLLWFRNRWRWAATVIRGPVQERMPLWFRNRWRSAATVIRKLVQEWMPDASYQKDAPRFALRPFLSELFGLTNEDSRFVYLSDGGHFENFGLYEMVRRRCRWIVLCDGARDPDRKYEDLGNAVRKIWIDLGVRVSFQDSPLLRATEETKPADLPYFALGTVEYLSDGSDGARPPRGHILYIKAAVRGDEAAADVIAYQRLNPDFPQQSTSDQWFDEPQLEAYRALGHLIMTKLVSVRGNAPNDLETLFAWLGRVDPISLTAKPSLFQFRGVSPGVARSSQLL